MSKGLGYPVGSLLTIVFPPFLRKGMGHPFMLGWLVGLMLAIVFPPLSVERRGAPGLWVIGADWRAGYSGSVWGRAK